MIQWRAPRSAAPVAMNPARRTTAPTTPQKRARRRSTAPRPSAPKTSAKTKRLSTERLFSSTKPVRYSSARVSPCQAQSRPVNPTPSAVQAMLQAAALPTDGRRPRPKKDEIDNERSDDGTREGEIGVGGRVHGSDSFRLMWASAGGLSRPSRAGATGSCDRTDDDARRG